MKGFWTNITLIILIFCALASTPHVYAGWVDDDYATCLEAADSGAVCSGAYVSHVDTSIYSDIVRRILGPVPGVTVTADAAQRNPEYVKRMAQGAAASQMSSVIATIYVNPPANFALWLRDTGETLGFVPKSAYAQGIGFSGLAPILPIWKAFRNISYALLAIIMIIIGFMVMLRKKIDPKTVVTVQNALPRIVMALLLVTFSYAIAAMVIDLMYLVMVLLINLLVGASNGVLGPDTASKYLTGGLGMTAGALFWGGWSSIDDIVKMIFYNQDTTTLAGQAQWVFSLVTDVATLGIRWALVWLIVSVALLFGLVRIVFMLLTAYIQIIISILTAPFQLMVEAIPGSSSFSSWIKNLFANVSVFPVTAAMFLIGTILTQSNVEGLWTPPLLTSGSGTKGVIGLIGLGIFLTIPTVVGSIKEALKAQTPVNAGPGAILGPLGAGAGQAFQLGYQASFIASAFKHKTEPSNPGGRAANAQKEGFGGIIPK